MAAGIGAVPAGIAVEHPTAQDGDARPIRGGGALLRCGRHKNADRRAQQPNPGPNHDRYSLAAGGLPQPSR